MNVQDFKRSVGGLNIMPIRGVVVLLFAVVVLASAAGVKAQTPPPAIFFTDIDSGPNSGGESVSGFAGAYVNIYGNNFGATQGTSTITWNGNNCLRVVSWGTSWLWYQKIAVQLGSSCPAGTGTFTVTVGGVASVAATVNSFKSGSLIPSQFTVRANGHIYCVSNSGSDSSAGTFAAGCWQTIPKAGHSMAAGDITYIENGVSSGSLDPQAQYNAVFSMTSGGTAGNPIALVAYPNATVTMNTSQNFCIRTPAVSGPGPYWTVAGITCTVTSNGEAFKFLQPHFRTVANILSCPNSFGTAACMEAESDGTDGHYIYGNTWTNVGTQVNGQKTYHALYFSTSDDHSDIAWNDIHQVHGCRGFQIYDSTGRDTTDIHVHDNLIHDVVCDGINLNGVRTDTGTVEVYNNVEYNVGTGPDPSDGAAIYSCVNIASNGTYSQPAQIYNNTCHNGGNSVTGNPSQSGGISAYLPIVLRNNLIYQSNGQPYLTSDAGCGKVMSGSTNNAWFGNGSSPNCSTLAASLNVDPLIASLSLFNFQLLVGSPLIDAGTSISTLTLDHAGITRPQGKGYDIGAYEYFAGGSTVQKPNPPTNLSVVVK
jgi:hypothetical protein